MNERAKQIISLLEMEVITADEAWDLFHLLDNNMHYILSEDEINALVKELKESFDPPVTIQVNPSGEIDCSGSIGPRKGYQAPEIKSPCMFHKWKLYTGLNEQFEYCEVCGDKKK